MAKMTSAYANKLLRKLDEDKEFWRRKEEEGSMYIAALDEEPVIPEYDYAAVAATIEEIDKKIVKIPTPAVHVGTGDGEEQIAVKTHVLPHLFNMLSTISSIRIRIF